MFHLSISPPNRCSLPLLTTNPCPSVFVFIITMLLLATDFYYLKNIAGRRLVGLRWWNEVDTGTGDSHWVFESQDRSGGTDDHGRERPAQNMTDKRFFWLALYCQPALWILLGVLAVIKFEFIWLILIGKSAFFVVRLDEGSSVQNPSIFCQESAQMGVWPRGHC